MGDEDNDVRITIETLFEIATRERNREEIQELPETFYADVARYISEKRRIIESSDSGPFAFEEKEKASAQLVSVKKIVKDIYERRERKIITIALNKSRTGSEIIDTSKLLPDETLMFDNLVSLMDTYRREILLSIIKGSVPNVNSVRYHSDSKDIPSDKPSGDETSPKASETQKSSETTLIRFKTAVPKFVGKELEVYGPFEEDDIANLPNEIADVLISKGRAEKM